MTSKKRGQVTVFIMIGLIILITYLALSHYKKEAIEEIEVIDPEMVPVQQYVQECTRNLASEAVELIGWNGGYIYFPPHVQVNPNSCLKLTPIDDLKNPYWWYDGTEAVPTLDFMGSQISQFTEEGMAACISNFSAFQDKYNVIELESFNVITTIGDEDITIDTIYPIEVQDKFNKTLAKLQKFPITLPIRLKKVHRLAKEIMARENTDMFIEKKAIDLISLDDSEIPTTGIDIDCGRKRWIVDDIENKLKSLLNTNLDYIKVKNTKFYETSMVTPYQYEDTNPFSESGLYNESYYYLHYIWDVTDLSYPNTHVTFSYDPNWPMEFYVRPNKGYYIESNPDRAGDILRLLCLHIWHFTYDVIFPVKVTIFDEQTKNNNPYSFTFAFKAQISHNRPDRTSFAIETFDTRDEYMEEEYCADTTNELIIYVQNIRSTSMIREISGVNLTFTCGRLTCDMGTTESDWERDSSGTPQLRKRFPYCSRGILKGSKQGYEDNEMFIETGRMPGTNPDDQQGRAYTLEMRPVKEFNFTVVRHDMIGEGVSGPKQLEENEQAMITIKNEEEDFESYSTYTKQVNATLKLMDKDDFDYDLQIIVIDETGNGTVSSGYKADWTVTKNSLVLGKKITFHVIGKEFEEDEERYAFFAGLSSYSEKVPFPEIR
ncbi:hypothetical protein KY358_05105 [Candidatus Woesearchaeota archaeon]|nr:hypothetical protein [Candidatus Woesearchaeota archaeon]